MWSVRQFECYSFVAHTTSFAQCYRKIKQITLTYFLCCFYFAIKWNYNLNLTDNIVEKVCEATTTFKVEKLYPRPDGGCGGWRNRTIFSARIIAKWICIEGFNNRSSMLRLAQIMFNTLQQRNSVQCTFRQEYRLIHVDLIHILPVQIWNKFIKIYSALDTHSLKRK